MAESGCVRDVAVQNLDVTGDIRLTGNLLSNVGNTVRRPVTHQALAAPAAAAAATNSRILATSNFVTLTQSNNASDRVYLPSPTAVADGTLITLFAVAACELSAEGDGTTATTINGVAVTNAGGVYAAEVLLTADTTYYCIKTGDNAWTVTASIAVPAADA